MSGILPTEESLIIPNQEDLDKMTFDFTPDTSQGKIVITIHGTKNSGKSTAAFLVTTGRIGGFRPGRTLAISFDDKTKTTYDQFFKGEPIVVQDGTKNYSENPKIKTKSGYISYVYLQKLLDHESKNDYDWVFFDGLTVESEILEMAMRYINGLRPTQGVANRNIWKDRGSMIRTLHAKAIKMAKVGVIYATYSDKDEIIQDGETVTKTDIPKYIDVVMLKTDVVLKATKAKGKDGNLFYVTVEGTKFKQYYDNGVLLPITDKTLTEGKLFNVTGMSDSIKPEYKMGQIEQSKILSIPNPLETKKPPIPIRSQSGEGKTILKEDIPTNPPKLEVKSLPSPTPIIKEEPKVKPKFEIPDLLL